MKYSLAVAALIGNVACNEWDHFAKRMERALDKQLHKIENHASKKLEKILGKIADDIDKEIDDIDMDEVAHEIEGEAEHWLEDELGFDLDLPHKKKVTKPITVVYKPPKKVD